MQIPIKGWGRNNNDEAGHLKCSGVTFPKACPNLKWVSNLSQTLSL